MGIKPPMKTENNLTALKETLSGLFNNWSNGLFVTNYTTENYPFYSIFIFPNRIEWNSFQAKKKKSVLIDLDKSIMEINNQLVTIDYLGDFLKQFNRVIDDIKHKRVHLYTISKKRSSQ